MTNFNPLKQSAKAAGIAAFLIAGYSTLVSAHSLEDCMWDVAQFCGSDHACKKSGYQGCLHHSHPGGPGVPPAPDPQSWFGNDPGWQLNKGGKFKKLGR